VLHVFNVGEGRGVISGKDPDGHHWELLVFGEVGNLGLQMTPEDDVFGT